MLHPKKIILCADDFGLSAGISQGIIRLVQQQRLSAVSCMVNFSSFNVHAKALLAYQPQVKMGLHFNLTEGYLLSQPEKACFSLNSLLICTHLHCLPSSFFIQEFNAQLDRYIEIMGRLPDFIDGHQHVHQFPQVRQAILQVYQQRMANSGAFIRATYPAVTFPEYRFKTMILAHSGGRKMSGQLKQLNIPHNPCFAGVYDFSPTANYRALFRHWLLRVPTNTLIMCHPAETSDCADVIAVARVNEFNYFLSDEFLRDCLEQQVELTTSPMP